MKGGEGRWVKEVEGRLVKGRGEGRWVNKVERRD